MITDTERLPRIGERLRIRGLIMAVHEEQLERIDGRLRDLYPAAFLEVVATTQGQSPPDFLAVAVQVEAQGQEPPDFLTGYVTADSLEACFRSIHSQGHQGQQE